MNAKTLFICLTILAVLSCSAQGLMMNNQKSLSHKARVFAHETVQKVLNLHMLSTSDEAEISNDMTKDLEQFLKKNPDVQAELQKGRISKASAIKIQNFFLNNQKFINEVVKVLDQDESIPQCLKNLNKSQKVKFVKIAIKGVDFQKLINDGDPSLTPAQQDSIIKAINDDKELGPSVAKCTNDLIKTPAKL